MVPFFDEKKLSSSNRVIFSDLVLQNVRVKLYNNKSSFFFLFYDNEWKFWYPIYELNFSDAISKECYRLLY